MEKSIDVLSKISSSLNRRDEEPNQELAREIIAMKDSKAVKELVESLSAKKAIQNDCIKVLYEIGEVNPDMITTYFTNFIFHLKSKNNRLQWGSMTAINCIAKVNPDLVYGHLSEILTSADTGSVITKDNAIAILIQFLTIPKYAENSFSLLNEQLAKSSTNQLPMYAERAMPFISDQMKAEFIDVLQSRLDDIEKESKRKRVEKVIKKLSK